MALLWNDALLVGVAAIDNQLFKTTGVGLKSISVVYLYKAVKSV